MDTNVNLYAISVIFGMDILSFSLIEARNTRCDGQLLKLIDFYFLLLSVADEVVWKVN